MLDGRFGDVMYVRQIVEIEVADRMDEDLMARERGVLKICSVGRHPLPQANECMHFG